MRMIRSLFLSLATMMVMTAATIAPAAASIPIDPGIRAELSVANQNPAPVASILKVDEQAIPCMIPRPSIEVAAGRQSVFGSGWQASSKSASVSLIEIRRRC